MKTNVPDNCANSPRSLLAMEIAINLAANKYDELAPLLSEGFSWSLAGGKEELSKSELNIHMKKATQPKNPIERFDLLSSISHGKYAAVSSRAYRLDGTISNSHDLYEFTSAGSSSKLRKITSYVVNI